MPVTPHAHGEEASSHLTARLRRSNSDADGGSDTVAVEPHVAVGGSKGPRSFQPQLEVVLERVTDSAVALQCLASSKIARLRRLRLRHRHVAATGDRIGVVGNRPGRSIDERGRKVEGDLHVGKMVLDRLVRTDRFAELVSRGAVLDRGLEEATGHADALGGRTARRSLAGEVGVVVIRSRQVMREYWRRPDATADASTDDGWFITGDIASMATDGRITLQGRASDMIISGGENIYPKEIELVLDEIDGISESAVIGVPDPDFGEQVVAVLVCEGAPLCNADIRPALDTALARFKHPRRIEVIDALPRNAMGKVNKRRLRAPYWPTDRTIG